MYRFVHPALFSTCRLKSSIHFKLDTCKYRNVLFHNFLYLHGTPISCSHDKYLFNSTGSISVHYLVACGQMTYQLWNWSHYHIPWQHRTKCHYIFDAVSYQNRQRFPCPWKERIMSNVTRSNIKINNTKILLWMFTVII